MQHAPKCEARLTARLVLSLCVAALSAMAASCSGASVSTERDSRYTVPDLGAAPLSGDIALLNHPCDHHVTNDPFEAVRMALSDASMLGGAVTEDGVELGWINVDTDSHTEAWLRVDQSLVLASLAVEPLPEPRPVSVERQTLAREQRTVGPGMIHMYAVNSRERIQVRLYDNAGRMRPDAVLEISQLLRDWRVDRTRTIEPRTIAMLYRVGQAYDAELEVISGYRVRGINASNGSRHGSAEACDFRIDGVRTRDLARFVDSSFAQVGVGYYPSSEFVHLDTRDASYYWTDRSGRGERSRERSRDADNTPRTTDDTTLASVNITEEDLYVLPPLSDTNDDDDD